MEHALRLADVHHDEQQAHGDGGDGQEFAEDDDLPELFVMVQVGHDQHDGRGGHADR